MADGYKLILNASIFLGVLTVLLGASNYADPGVIGGGQESVQAETCVDANNTIQNIQCAMTQAEDVSDLVGTGSNRIVNLVILVPLSVVIAFLVIVHIIIPAIRGG